MWRWLLITVVLLLLDYAACAQAQSHQRSSWMNLKSKTFGGKQFWADICFFRDLRIQQNVFTNHYRLLDGNNQRLTWGSFDVCRQKLNEIRDARQLPEMSGKAVVLLHGIIRTATSFDRMKDSLEKEGYLVFAVNYPSTQITIQQAAGQLQQVLQSLVGVEQISLVGHSMGGLVIRAWFRDYKDKRVDKVIMLGTPNQGAELADYLKRSLPYKWVMGKAGQQLGTRQSDLPSQLPVPTVPFGIIAGGLGENTKGYNSLLPGDNDGTVTVASTHLKGEEDFLRLPCLHMFLMRDERVLKAVSQFLKSRQFPCSADASADDATQKNAAKPNTNEAQ